MKLIVQLILYTLQDEASIRIGNSNWHGVKVLLDIRSKINY